MDQCALETDQQTNTLSIIKQSTGGGRHRERNLCIRNSTKARQGRAGHTHTHTYTYKHTYTYRVQTDRQTTYETLCQKSASHRHPSSTHPQPHPHSHPFTAAQARCKKNNQTRTPAQRTYLLSIYVCVCHLIVCLDVTH
uniref:Uncharacterized protein n=1 Tax=Vitrella brassicaformis TaxID=1169539 RepID=A0A7S1JV11_9ALVE